jgi:hypothetical protein
MSAAGGISLQITEIEIRVVLPQFLVDGIIKAVGNIDNTLNDERYSFVNLHNQLITPWHQSCPIKPIGVAEGTVKIEDMLLVYPTDPEDQAQIQLMPKAQTGIMYVDDFVIRGDISMGADMELSTVLEGVSKRFLTVTNVSLFPLFSAATSIPEEMPVVLVRRDRVYQIHAPD